MSEAKLIGDNIVGSLRFSSSDRERRFLAEAGSSFGFPLMEKRLMSTGVSQILQDVEDLSLKAFVASRCASRQLRIDNERTSQLARMEERVVALEKEKSALEEALVAARAEAKNHAEAAEAARRDALGAEKAKENAEKAKAEAEEARRVAEAQRACGKDVQRWRTAISSFADLVQTDIHGLLAKFAIDPPEISFKRRQKSSLEASFARLKPATCAAALPVAAKTEPLAMARAKIAGGKRMMLRRSPRCDD
ncbi:translation initiation factor IF-2-like [Panicum virgatum]|uniref:translation initiation factor IF-2-like n=1 Tax=Panicum virgatum TaxID=38727 RepID=UPI0019D64EAC|nr:translation initiation factor IF-2-like [Panicum virgatum]